MFAPVTSWGEPLRLLKSALCRCDRLAGVFTGQEAFFPKGLSDKGALNILNQDAPSPRPFFWP